MFLTLLLAPLLFFIPSRMSERTGKGMVQELKTDTVDGKAPVKRASNRALDKHMSARVRKGRDFLHPHQKGQMTTKQVNDWLLKQQPTHPCSQRTSSAYRNGYTKAEEVRLAMKLSVRELAVKLRALKRANVEGGRFSKRKKGERTSTRGQQLSERQEADIEDARGHFFDEPVPNITDGLSDSDSDSDSLGRKGGEDCSSAGKKRPADVLPSMALNEAETRRMVSYLARQMNFPPEFSTLTLACQIGEEARAAPSTLSPVCST